MGRRVAPRGQTVGAALAVVAALGLAACGGSGGTLRTADVEKVLVDGFAAQVGGSFTARCPAQIPAEQGRAFACTVTDAQTGATVHVDVVEDDGDGAFSWRAGGVSTGSGPASPSADSQATGT